MGDFTARAGLGRRDLVIAAVVMMVGVTELMLRGGVPLQYASAALAGAILLARARVSVVVAFIESGGVALLILGGYEVGYLYIVLTLIVSSDSLGFWEPLAKSFAAIACIIGALAGGAIMGGVELLLAAGLVASVLIPWVYGATLRRLIIYESARGPHHGIGP